ncbi:cobyrinate a,c-diamide synthase [Streptomyces alkaliphilus]|uniref:Hydrogenobyrinate a,c-diamide synthase n=1 Tax=Streptomyces alkaliphilus TaxID=1472722 RepID=A0A7W3TB59_9ACTN|nr:cobyrinate a,c-diamide synthase [Streptomyces alkaliphilus]MBB0243614.1 cobyrinate a,c-diamide synthase [Streptomyces alkaliphilus]
MTPRVVIAAPGSGSGKTTVATGLMAAFTEAGLRVSAHKVGPDYIDPGYHALATGRPGRNLDAWMCGPDRVAPLFRHGAAGADLAVVEGVMGLFDGASGMGETASTAHVAKLLRAPVVLVVDASAQSRSIAALVHGFASWDTGVRLAGVILNKVGSPRHESLLREALDGGGVPVLGALPREDGPVRTPSRHLGLVPVAERRAEALESVRAMAERVRRGVDLSAVLAVARAAPAAGGPVWCPAEAVAGAEREWDPAAPGVPSQDPPGRAPVVAVASGAAFTFGYAEHPELLEAAGARVVTFDPLRDEALPTDAEALVIGGGFPEVYAPELAANEPLRRAVAAFDGPVVAECAGLLYLCRSLDGARMCGVLPAEARMTRRLTLGYREAVALTDNPLAPAGGRVRGHEFHRTVVEPGAGEAPAWGFTHPERRAEGFVRGRVHASYLHVHWAGAPGVPRRLVAGCRQRAAARVRNGAS